ncbi:MULTISPECIES: nucleoside triphosphate pyrophosphohydrolase [Mycobacterium]|uniref:Nucleoside triphosphate pyrophosphohydrolase n=1 Tax=Mycobacterium kiyosense TaxID=2871094 RepID=A0A9P3Q5Q5_9MYCO|nr:MULTISPECIES: nucleoside triphosphate pyrophosphohydrolase [Mycobacterium]BDE16184.1 nucleoside triphosphate pyrophosphohydrolase [Mycobacterium sp. 20KCMC460]GLB82145.1 nucleoside triphosphate pyrophosphohydrolase [Mycobacterium kiyosense]GLB90564.1 nucleoside triphosphate pyrophosphohydrolase [Mycobacterium kiyosense]GLB95287.1 nucleoside triphosphate pyrophosphohydrolase [Mycobacterium kiyosense]GLC00240.1 nucleoside triphosphate pyrophosphohydrolase [Mycobacterium kiyosense]
MIVVLVDPRRPALVPVEAIELLCGQVQYTEEMPIAVPWSLPDAHPAYTGEEAPVLLSSDPKHPAVTARLAAGARLIAAPERQRGERLVDAVAMMDKLRTAGPWESEQTHDSLRRYLLEETYELLDAVQSGNIDALRDELGDLLLQVLFHARIAEDEALLPFSIDDVADTLMRKLGNRVPGVLAGEEISLQDQLAQWEEAKASERSRKSRNSVLDDVHTGQPALALAQKVIQRVTQAGVPGEFIPAELTTITLTPEVDAENDLRAAVLDFVETVRTAERAIAAARRGDSIAEELDMAPLGFVTEEEWRAHWPTGGGAAGYQTGPDEAPEDSLVDVLDPEQAATEASAAKESRGGAKKRKGRR